MINFVRTTIAGVMLLIFLGLASCNSHDDNLAPMPNSDAQSTPDRAASLTLDDVFGEHNPKMIGGWGGMKTHEEWFLRRVRDYNRFNLLQNGLSYWYAQYGQFPSSWEQLDEAGFFPIRPLDPISGSQINFHSQPTSDDDFIHVWSAAGYAGWSIDGRTPMYPDGEWISHTWDFNPPTDEMGLEIADYRAQMYPNAIAMKGAMFADALESVLFDYAHRRALMPASSDEMLDGLWVVANDRAANNPAVDPDEPGGFLFGIDESEMLSIAVWYDDQGNKYSLAWKWNPWPDGWEDIPKAGESEGYEGLPWTAYPEDFIPATVLWTCSFL